MAGGTTFLIASNDLLVLVVRKEHAKFAVARSTFTKRRKWMADLIARRDCNVTVRADLRRRTLARKELRAVTLETRIVTGKLSHIRKGSIALTHVFPVLSGKLVAAVTLNPLSRNVCGV